MTAAISDLPAAFALLAAVGPHPDHREELRLFGQFVGDWELDVTWHEGEHRGRAEKGEWHFAYALDGRAIVDVWIVPSRAERERGAKPYEWGLSVRFYDPAIQAWRSTWLGPAHAAVIPFVARTIGDEIVLEGQSADGWPMRWIFSDITPHSFEWRQVRSPDGGATWVLFQSMKVRRSA